MTPDALPVSRAMWAGGSVRLSGIAGCLALALLTAPAVTAQGQNPGSQNAGGQALGDLRGGGQDQGGLSLGGQPNRPKQFVSYAAEPQEIAAGHPGFVELRFQVRDGYHVNSHHPRSDLQIPTRLELPGVVPGLKLGPAEYPAGHPYRLADDTLDVYSESFVIRLPVTATAGQHQLDGTLRYQACDHAACYPPRTLPVTVLFQAR